MTPGEGIFLCLLTFWAKIRLKWQQVATQLKTHKHDLSEGKNSLRGPWGGHVKMQDMYPWASQGSPRNARTISADILNMFSMAVCQQVQPGRKRRLMCETSKPGMTSKRQIHISTGMRTEEAEAVNRTSTTCLEGCCGMLWRCPMTSASEIEIKTFRHSYFLLQRHMW